MFREAPSCRASKFYGARHWSDRKGSFLGTRVPETFWYLPSGKGNRSLPPDERQGKYARLARLICIDPPLSTKREELWFPGPSAHHRGLCSLSEQAPSVNRTPKTPRRRPPLSNLFIHTSASKLLIIVNLYVQYAFVI